MLRGGAERQVDMRRSLTLLATVMILTGLMAAPAAADPGPNNPQLQTVSNVDCEGDDHDYDLLYTIDHYPWFDANSTTVSPGPVSVSIEEDGQWVLLFEKNGKGIPTLFCSWSRGDNNYRGDLRFSGKK